MLTSQPASGSLDMRDFAADMASRELPTTHPHYFLHLLFYVHARFSDAALRTLMVPVANEGLLRYVPCSMAPLTARLYNDDRDAFVRLAARCAALSVAESSLFDAQGAGVPRDVDLMPPARATSPQHAALAFSPLTDADVRRIRDDLVS